MKLRLVFFVVLAVLISGTASANSMPPTNPIGSLLPVLSGRPQGLIEGIVGWGLNTLMPKKREELAAGKVSLNVYFVEDNGSLLFLGVMDGGMNHVATFNDRIALEPVVTVNATNTPREVQFMRQGTGIGFSKIAYIPVKGGGRGRNGQAKDNAGYQYKVPLVYAKDLLDGYHAVSASWNENGGSAIIHFVKHNWRNFFALYEREDVREAIAGAGMAMAPQMPTVFGVVNGNPVAFKSKEELQAVMSDPNFLASLVNKGKEASAGTPVKDSVKKPDTDSPADRNRETGWKGSWYFGRYQVYNDELYDQLVRTKPYTFAEDQVKIRSNSKTGVLLVHTEPFEVRLFEGDRLVRTFKSSNRQGRSHVLIGLNTKNSVNGRVEAIGQNGQKSVLVLEAN